MTKLAFKHAGLDEQQALGAIESLQTALDTYNDLALILKHAHWNVVGANFIAVHEMLDPQIDEVRDFVDQIAERIAGMGGSPNGLASSAFNNSTISDFENIGRAKTENYLKILDSVYDRLVVTIRAEIAKLDEFDLVSSNILQDCLGANEQFSWFIKSHLL
jgi:starvation-inducible DNA-binding protein